MTAAARMRGASLTGVIAIVLVATRVSTPSVTVVVKVRGAVLLRAGKYATRPSVLKYAVNAVGEPVRIRAVGVPVTVTPPAVAAKTLPSGTETVTLSEGESMSVKPGGDAGHGRLERVSYRTTKRAGANTTGASLTATICSREALLEVSVWPPCRSAITMDSRVFVVELRAGV